MFRNVYSIPLEKDTKKIFYLQFFISSINIHQIFSWADYFVENVVDVSKSKFERVVRLGI